MAWSILRCDEVDSTNNVCKALAAQGADNTAVIVRRQAAGKGRLGRSFLSPEGGLYLSVLWRGCPAEQLLTVTPLAAVAVPRHPAGLRRGVRHQVVQRRGAGGAEAVRHPDGEPACGRTAVQSGWWWVSASTWRRRPFRRVSRTSPPPLPCGVQRVPGRAGGGLLEQLTAMRQALPHPQAWREEYRRRCVNLGRPVRVLRGDASRQAIALDVDQQFGLTVQYENGETETVRSGEVSVRGLYGYIE